EILVVQGWASWPCLPSTSRCGSTRAAARATARGRARRRAGRGRRVRVRRGHVLFARTAGGAAGRLGGGREHGREDEGRPIARKKDPARVDVARGDRRGEELFVDANGAYDRDDAVERAGRGGVLESENGAALRPDRSLAGHGLALKQ